MSILPYEKLIINTNLTSEEIIEKLNEYIEPYQPFRNKFKPPNKPYNGKIDGNNFTIARNINYRNSFLPIVKGKIISDYQGSIINITLSLHPVIIVFIGFWLYMTGGMGFFFLISMITSGEFMLGGLIPLGMFIFGCLLTIIPFKVEAKIAKKFLQDLFSTI